ncbi:fumarylacetoacetase [Chondrinema litorale]|uniref:fumarylacetoacetase n=1 Tax=Chondrinema litorale TaxID=2994555 RepID=UPI002542EFD1|nr:fumarylacetoacetase [Chondrinema litorale]UZR97957.1 fumarylacetoacetase [Chondrinema litorale]
MQSWINIPENCDFTIYNLPFGVFMHPTGEPRVGVAIGEYIIDMAETASLGLLDSTDAPKEVFRSKYLNDFIALGRPVWARTRHVLTELLLEGNDRLRAHQDTVLQPIEGTQMLLPIRIGDYTDFYSSIEHASNVGKMFRPDNPLLPNWKHLPVAYHGRSSTIVVSGTDIHRPQGQTMPKDAEKPVFGPSNRMDFELETAFVVGETTEMGHAVSVAEAEKYIFGMVLFNDWSARDIQKWEYVPLGPFLGKNFASSISPWIVTLEALEPFRTECPTQEPEPLNYLKSSRKKTFDINLEVSIQCNTDKEYQLCQSNFKHLYWNMSQQLAHHTVNGCKINVGDLIASGTISGKEADSLGSMLELSWGGKEKLKLDYGVERTFLEDYDTVIMRGFAEKNGIRVGFGEVRSQLLPAIITEHH